jgi:hypothetical protein
MPMDQFPPDDFHLNLLRALRSRRTAIAVLIRGPIRKGKILASLQAEKQTTSLAPRVKPVDASICKVKAVSPGASEFNWWDYYARALTALMSDVDEISPGE